MASDDFVVTPWNVEGDIDYDKLINLIPIMSSTLYFSRITGVLLIVGFLVNTI